MQILFNKRFECELYEILDYIAQDSVAKMENFRQKLFEKIVNITHFPHSYRQNLTAQNPNIRDLIFKGYIVPFVINENAQSIEILGIYKSNVWHLESIHTDDFPK